MKLPVRTPVCVRGHVKGFRNEQDIVTTVIDDHDIPEISLSETEIGLRTTSVFSGNGRIIGRGRTLRTYGGRLYRPMFEDVREDDREQPAHRRDSRPTVVDAAILSEAFHDQFGVSEAGSDLSFRNPGRANTASLPIVWFYSWLLNFHRRGTVSRYFDAWPRPGGVVDGEAVPVPYWSGSRDSRTFDEIRPFLRDFNSDDLATARRMRAVQLSKLLLVDGVLHYACREPAIVVKGSAWPHGNSSSDIVMRLCTMPEWVEPDLTARFFPVSAMDAAREHAERLDFEREHAETRVDPATLKRRKHVNDHVPQFEVSDGLPTVSTDEDIVWRTGMGLTQAVVRYLRAVPARERAVSEDERRTLGLAHRLALRHDPTTAATGDFGEVLPELAGLWRSLGRPEAKASDGADNRHDGRRKSMLDEVLALAAERPISVMDVGIPGEPG